MGVQDGFNWKSVGLSALSAGIANGLNTPALMGGSGWQDTALRMAATNTLTQGIGVATGLQRSFDWRGVAASAAGGAVGSQVADQLKDSSLFSDWSSTAADLARGTLGGLAAGTTAAVARGGRISMQQVATDAFGNALGGSIASASTNGGSQQESGRYSLSSGNRKLGLQAPADWGSPGWSNSSAGYDQLVDVFSNPGVIDRSSDVLLAAGPGYSGSNRRVDPGSMESIRQPDGTYRVDIVGHSGEVTGPSVNGMSANVGSGTYEDPRTTVNPLTVRASDFGDLSDWQINNAGNGLNPSQAALDAFFGGHFFGGEAGFAGLTFGGSSSLSGWQRTQAHALGVYDAGAGAVESAGYGFGVVGTPESRAAWAQQAARESVEFIRRVGSDPVGSMKGWWGNLTGDDPAAIRQATAQGAGLALGVAGGVATGRLQGGLRAGTAAELDMFRRVTNQGAFADLPVLMDLKTVRGYANEAGIGLDGVKVRIVRDESLLGSGFGGYTHPNGKSIDLYPDAFSSPEELVRTLGHERMHVYQARTFGEPRGQLELRLNENAAYGLEESFVQYWRLNKGR